VLTPAPLIPPARPAPPAPQAEYAAVLRTLVLAREGAPRHWSAWRAAVLPHVSQHAPSTAAGKPSNWQQQQQQQQEACAADAGGVYWLLPGVPPTRGVLSDEERQLAAAPGWAEPACSRVRRYVAALAEAVMELDVGSKPLVR
jgi:hypothetical protein